MKQSVQFMLIEINIFDNIKLDIYDRYGDFRKIV